MLVGRGSWGKCDLLLNRVHIDIEITSPHMQLGSVYTSPSY